MNSSASAGWKQEALLLTVVLIWGLNFVVMKTVLMVMHPHVMNLFRMAFSALVLAGAYTFQVKGDGARFVSPMRLEPLRIIGVGILGYVIYQIVFIMGLNATVAGSAALIMTSSPIWTALLALLLGLDRLKPLAWLGLALSLAGTVGIVLAGGAEVSLGRSVLMGNLLMVLAAFLWGAYTTLMRPLVQRHSPLGLTFFSVAISLPILFLIALPHFAETHWETVTPLFWLAIAASGGLSTGVATVLWNGAVKAVGPSHTAAYQNAIPVVALISSAFFLNDPILLGQLAGGALTITGLVLMRRARIRP